MPKVKFAVEVVYRFKGEVEIDEEDAERFESNPSSFGEFYSINENPDLSDWKVKRKK